MGHIESKDVIFYAFLAFMGFYFVRRHLKFRRVKTHLSEYLQAGAQIVDVRTPAEFASGHVDGSVNIPLQELESGAARLDKSKKILLCCASGTRSGMAELILKRRGFKDITNAGSWVNLR